MKETSSASGRFLRCIALYAWIASALGCGTSCQLQVAVPSGVGISDVHIGGRPVASYEVIVPCGEHEVEWRQGGRGRIAKILVARGDNYVFFSNKKLFFAVDGNVRIVDITP